MAPRIPEKVVPLNVLRDRIAEAIAGNAKSYDVPTICLKAGIQEAISDTDADEAHRSKRIYVRSRLLALSGVELIKIANEVLKELDAPELAETVSEMTVHADQRVTEITRRDILKALNELEQLFGETPVTDGLNIISEETISFDGIGSPYCFTPPLTEDIYQHYVRNDDYSHEEVLILCGALTCSQTRFFAFLEKLLDPVIRRGEEQSQFVARLNAILRVDGFCAAVVGEQSRHPIYKIRKIGDGTSGIVKNLIFASVGPKPEIILRDAINNDIEIVKHADMCLVYDRHLSAGGLTWIDMAEWWKERQGLSDLAAARKSLGERLKRSVEITNSPGEYAIFRTYHEVLGKQIGDRLPALIPQVYLHYDPLTVSERLTLGKEIVLERQRMDFLMLLEGHIRIVIEVDGKEHYAEGEKASPRHYAKMAEEDRRLRLSGYEIYRFGGAEFSDTDLMDGRYKVGANSKKIVTEFFHHLFRRHKIG